ncbi:TauD/TfdA family dioxygenase [Burkholderia gladioli]|uniref:TauD/TfdA family dioxygenase n=1 Tax=Burkholderia gladioli TaxID=28095 RepID=UPI00163F01F0|nr:TauD/TfdA family dioxygenase [Burkholderia gladioli]
MDIIEQALNPGTRMPLLIQSREPGLPAADYAAARREHLLSRVEACGAVVLRGFAVPDAAAFGAFVEALRLAPMPYLYRSTPRTSVAGGLYTATEYPADREIPLHNENAYQRSWPHKIAFCCLQPAAGGGATPLADMLEVQRRLDPGLLARFGRLGVRYDRVYHEGFDLPWTVVFQTSERAELQRFCQANQIEHEWLEDGSLRTRQVSQGTVIHPASGREYFFNQAHLFHPSSLGEETRADLVDAFGEDRLPRNACFGNGEPIDDASLAAVRAAFDAAAVDIAWQRGDIVLADNIQVAHGRRSYTGERRVLTSLLEPSC